MASMRQFMAAQGNKHYGVARLAQNFPALALTGQ